MGTVRSRCDLCHMWAPNDDSDYVFDVRGRGKYHGRVVCEACLRAKLARKSTRPP